MQEYVVPPYPLFSAPTKILDPLIRAKLQEHYDFLINLPSSKRPLVFYLGLGNANPLDVKLGAEVELFVNAPEYYEEGADTTKANKTKKHGLVVEEFRSELAERLSDILLPARARDRYKGWANPPRGKRHHDRGGLSRDGFALLEARTQPMPLDDIVAAYAQIAAEVDRLIDEMDDVAATVPHSLHVHQSARQGKRNAYFQGKEEQEIKFFGVLTVYGLLDFWKRTRPLAGLPRDLVLGYEVGEKAERPGIGVKKTGNQHRFESRFHAREWAAHPELSLLLIFAGIRHGAETCEESLTGNYKILSKRFRLDVPYTEAIRNMENDDAVRQLLGDDLLEGLCRIVKHYPAIETGEKSLDTVRQVVNDDPEIAKILERNAAQPPKPTRGVRTSGGARGR